MKTYCEDCVEFEKPFNCKLYGTPLGTKKCKNYKQKIKKYYYCKSCEYAEEKSNSCIIGFYPAIDEFKCRSYIENKKRGEHND